MSLLSSSIRLSVELKCVIPKTDYCIGEKEFPCVKFSLFL